MRLHRIVVAPIHPKPSHERSSPPEGEAVTSALVSLQAGTRQALSSGPFVGFLPPILSLSLSHLCRLKYAPLSGSKALSVEARIDDIVLDR